MKHIFFSTGAICWLLTLIPVFGQTVFFKDGKSLKGKNLRIAGSSLFTTIAVGEGQGEVGYPVSSIAKIDFPKPDQIATAENLLVTGKAAEALAQIEPVVAGYTSFKDIPGNFWLEAASVKLTILHDLNRDAVAAPLVEEMLATKSDPEAVLAGRVWRAAQLLGKGDVEKALAMLEEVTSKSQQANTLANAWLQKGLCLVQSEKYPEALVAVLHVPVFYPEQKTALPAALLTSGQAFTAMEDFSRAQRAMEDLLKAWPTSAEAKVAKTELPKIERRLKSAPAPSPADSAS